jgi:hypothetical protein
MKLDKTRFPVEDGKILGIYAARELSAPINFSSWFMRDDSYFGGASFQRDPFGQGADPPGTAIGDQQRDL